MYGRVFQGTEAEQAKGYVKARMRDTMRDSFVIANLIQRAWGQADLSELEVNQMMIDALSEERSRLLREQNQQPADAEERRYFVKGRCVRITRKANRSPSGSDTGVKAADIYHREEKVKQTLKEKNIQFARPFYNGDLFFSETTK